MDSTGIAVVHPDKDVENTDNTEFAFVLEQLKLKEGYLEPEWKNPGEEFPRQNALYMKGIAWIYTDVIGIYYVFAFTKIIINYGNMSH